MTECSYAKNESGPRYGPMDPSKNETFTFLKDLFGEVLTVFPDKAVHLGGDEVDFTCWCVSFPPWQNEAKPCSNSGQKSKELCLQKID